MSDKKDHEALGPMDPKYGEVEDAPGYSHDAVFGEMGEDGPNYRSVGWLGSAVLMMKSQIGIGVLSIPIAFDALGIVPGVICLLAIGGITTWSDYIIGVFKLRHPEVYGIDDVGQLLFGKTGRIVLGAAFCLWWTFVAGSGMLGLSIGLNSVSSHATCTAVWVAIAAILGFLFGSIQTLGRISWLAWVGLFSVLASILIVTIAVGVQDRPASAPQDGVWVSDYKIINSDATFTQAITALTTIVFAYAGTPAFFSIASEMRDPTHYNRALIMCQAVVTAFYLIIGIVMYYFCGSYVASPALGSGGATIKIVSYGFALPGLLASTLLFVHITGKYIFVRILSGTRHLAANTVTHWVTWIGCTAGVALIAYIIASAIPVFSDLVSLVGALLGTPMCFQPMAGMWLYDNWHTPGPKTLGWKLMVAWCGFVILSGTFLMIGGTYGSVITIMESYAKSGGSAAWSCADNS
ncbi:transmembrane amino acid transporter protein-domain-containing protein [Aspergillus taichungensis]|uniref:Transmembrane amino acid transporter protein-domain-containing protein n=1 Tax=Aspergillus taichungensis TaxID=482145 RepID=A0A2J5HIH8_9EURO|nr:transmembrane amino acid transporter protein-domain-containing protein [Aspergillus taichungensis]